MRLLFKVLGFTFSWIMLGVIIWINHVVLTPKTWDVDMFGLMVIVAVIVGFIKYLENKTKVWEIQNKNKLLRIHWVNGKKIVFVILLTWILYTIEDDLPKMQWTAVLISASLIIGWVFTTLGNINKKKGTP